MNLEINEATLKPVAEKLVARLNQLGVLTKAGQPLVVDLGYEAVAAMLGKRNQHALRAALAQEGKCACCAAPADRPNDTMIGVLTLLGYSVALSDFKRPFWQHGDDASEDFSSEAEAWQAALADARARGRFTDGSAAQTDSQSEMAQTIAELETRWGDEHGWYGREEWQTDVAAGSTRLGYWEWVAHSIEGNGGEEEHCDECGAPLDGEGWDGKCGNCADQACVVDGHCTECGEYERECTCEDLSAETQPGIGAANAASYEIDANAAQQAYETFDFQGVLGESAVVATRNGWECCTRVSHQTGQQLTRQFSCTVFVEDGNKPDEPTRKVGFSVDVVDGVAKHPRLVA